MSSIRFFGLFSFGLLFATSVVALDVGFSGYFRARGNYFYNLDLDRKQSPNVRAFTDMRFRLNPTFFITDKIRIRSSLNFFDGTLGNGPLRVSPFRNPSSATDPVFDPTVSGLTVGTPTNPNSVYGGAVAPDGAIQTMGLSTIYVRRVWAEIEIPYGIIKVGRMPNNFGYGIFANGGDNPDQEVGSTRDRILFETAMGPYYLIPGIGWIYEGYLNRGTDDYIEYFFIFGRKTETDDLGIYINYLNQNRSQSQDPSDGSNINTNFDQKKTNFWAFDFYAKGKFNRLTLGGEVTLFTGKYVGMDLLAVNAMLRGEVDYQPWKFLIESGYSSGTTATDVAKNDLKTFQFARDYDISMIVFEEALPGRNETAPRSGAISNTIYGRFNIAHDTAPFFKPSLNVVVPFAAKEAFGAKGRMYGVEYDIITKWPFDEHWQADLSFAHFLPMSFYDGVSRSHSTFLIRAGLVATF